MHLVGNNIDPLIRVLHRVGGNYIARWDPETARDTKSLRGKRIILLDIDTISRRTLKQPLLRLLQTKYRTGLVLLHSKRDHTPLQIGTLKHYRGLRITENDLPISYEELLQAAVQDEPQDIPSLKNIVSNEIAVLVATHAETKGWLSSLAPELISNVLALSEVTSDIEKLAKERSMPSLKVTQRQVAVELETLCYVVKNHSNYLRVTVFVAPQTDAQSDIYTNDEHLITEVCSNMLSLTE